MFHVCFPGHVWVCWIGEGQNHLCPSILNWNSSWEPIMLFQHLPVAWSSVALLKWHCWLPNLTTTHPQTAKKVERGELLHCHKVFPSFEKLVGRDSSPPECNCLWRDLESWCLQQNRKEIRKMITKRLNNCMNIHQHVLTSTLTGQLKFPSHIPNKFLYEKKNHRKRLEWWVPPRHPCSRWSARTRRSSKPGRPRAPGRPEGLAARGAAAPWVRPKSCRTWRFWGVHLTNFEDFGIYAKRFGVSWGFV